MAVMTASGVRAAISSRLGIRSCACGLSWQVPQRSLYSAAPSGAPAHTQLVRTANAANGNLDERIKPSKGDTLTQHNCIGAARLAVMEAAVLFLEHFFDLADLLLDRPGEFLILAVGSQVRVIGEFPGFFLGVALDFVKRALDLILRARFHVRFPLLVGKAFRRPSSIAAPAWQLSPAVECRM
jgi:hypothetical protein